MRSYRIAAPGAGIEGLAVTDDPVPRPGRGQVLVRMRAASLNHRDLAVVTGRYARAPVRAGLVPLSDGAGEVAGVGPGVDRVAAGDRVAGTMVQGWIGGEVGEEHAPTVLGGEAEGVLAEYRVSDQAGLVRLPPHLSFEEGATLPCAAVTAWNALHGGPRPLRPGEDVLVLGTGGVAVFALQFARLAGARAIVTSSSDAKLARALGLGAAEGVNHRAVPEWQEEVLRLTGGRGVDHAVETVGGGTLARSVAATRYGGWVHLIGALAGGEVAPSVVLRRAVTLRGVVVGSREMFEAMNRAIALHKMRPVIDRVFPFAEAPAAFRHLQGGSHLGKVVVAIG